MPYKYSAEIIEALAQHLHAESNDTAQWDGAGLHVRCQFRDEANALLDREAERVWDECNTAHAKYRLALWDFDCGELDEFPDFPTNPYQE